MRKKSYPLALGGMLAALATVLQLLGGLIPVNTYVTPTLCLLLLQAVLTLCGKRIGWAWYGAVSLLGLLLAADKEAAAVFLTLGSYPLLRNWIQNRKLPLLWKLAYFNILILLMYRVLLFVIGMPALEQEFSEMGKGMLILLLVLGNVCFLMTDRILSRMAQPGYWEAMRKRYGK